MQALGAIGDSSAIRGLEDCLQERNFVAVDHAFRALIALGDEKAVSIASRRLELEQRILREKVNDERNFELNLLSADISKLHMENSISRSTPPTLSPSLRAKMSEQHLILPPWSVEFRNKVKGDMN